MTDITITRPMQRWHKLVKALDEVRPGLSGADAEFCDKARKAIGEATWNEMGTEPFGITRKGDSWFKLVDFCCRHVIGCKDIREQLAPVPRPEPEPTPDPEDVAYSKRLMEMTDEEFEEHFRPEPEPVDEQRMLF